MKQIKFRAWDTERNEWIKGFFIDADDGSITYNCVNDSIYGDNYILEQFTGLHDTTGKEIYEGDVVQCVNGHVGAVIWEEHDCCFNIIDYYNCSDEYPTMAFIEGQPFKVIGNIHESPELIKEST